MKKIYFLALSAIVSFNGFSQKLINRDPQIEALVSQISSDSLKKFDEKLVSFGTRSTLSTTTDPKRGIGASRLWVLSKFQEFAKTSEGRMTAVLDTFTLQPDGKRVDKAILMANVMATLKGTDPNDDRVFMVSGHIDSRVTDVMNRESDAPGANDDGSGTVAVIELARVMAKSKFPATIIFVVVSGEEQGLLGANYLAEKAIKQNWNLEALLNNDIMGSNNSNETNIIDNTRLRVFSEGLPAFEMDKKVGAIRQYGVENDGKARQLARYVKEVGERYVDNLEVVMIYRNDRFLRGGDHTPFVNRGFAAVRLSEMNENFLHQHQDLRVEKGVEYGDLIKFMDFEYLRKNTCVNLATLANLAKSPAMPQDVVLDVRGLGNSTNLNWKAPKSGKVKGYYVLMRETAMPYWQKKFFTPNLKITLPYSKDNYFFAVQSVSEDGNESLPVLPRVGLRNAGE
ncbi:peptidase M28 [Emticicia oligotrophica DSM 17448]|uniref:Peptidase M28 n=1 Tax=Emticicia oligotrophica (strain DSM 17448 / CIP 109782 / MTCC 6937 / GPTSA100-15) TaxID=929562 RepID=A0ABM5N6V1_EMTOG|nr:M20/M25/M40 family metallo-hydrolase [Emticicia oligotrophica]AFK05219.1 peptidase M28 [Emticicia oligotrophica DSM 17448]